jgi:GrpB-like predicted nucleotidyltransferase (UPF0157 family)
MMETIETSDYDRGWPLQYEIEQTALRKAIGQPVVALEHVGSASIPGMKARRKLDIIAGIQILPIDAELCVARLVNLGWEHCPAIEARLPLAEGRRYLQKPRGMEHVGRRTRQLRPCSE